MERSRKYSFKWVLYLGFAMATLGGVNHILAATITVKCLPDGGSCSCSGSSCDGSDGKCDEKAECSCFPPAESNEWDKCELQCAPCTPHLEEPI